MRQDRRPPPPAPARRSGNRRGARIGVVWGLMALGSVTALVYTATGDAGKARLAALFEPRAETAAVPDLRDDLGRMSNEITRLRSETRLLALEKEALQVKIAALENEIGPVTGSLPDARRAEPEPVTELLPVADIRPDAAPAHPAAPRETVDVGFAPLPLDVRSDDAAATPPEEAIQADLARMAHPAARALPTEISRTRFAVEIGAADTMAGLRELWRRLSRENRPLIGALDPAVALTEQDGTLRLRLLAGPFANAADAIQLCAVLVRRGVDCRAVPSEGQQLVMQ